MKPKKHRARGAGTPEVFFQRELAGEAPLTLATAKALCEVAAELLELCPWDLLGEDQLVMVRAGEPEELCTCGAIGGLGEVLALNVYREPEGYQFIQSILAGEPLERGDVLARRSTVELEFVRMGELTGPDRELLRAVGRAPRTGTRAPVFRAGRPGYHPWYVTEGEGRLLLTCARAVTWMCATLLKDGGTDYWEQPGVYPLVAAVEGEAGHEVRLVKPPVLPTRVPVLPVLDEKRLQLIRERKLPVRGTLQADEVRSMAMIGQKHERKACIRVGLAVNADTGLAYPPETVMPETLSGELLVEVVLRAIEYGRAIPAEAHVRKLEYQIGLGPLGKALGFPIKVRKQLPALELAKAHMLAMLEGRGMGDL